MIFPDKTFLEKIVDHIQEANVTVGHVPWEIAGDECGAFKPREEQRYACYAMVGLPFHKTKVFENSLPRPGKRDGFSAEQFPAVSSLFKHLHGHAAVIFFDLKDSKIAKLINRLKKMRKSSILPKPEKEATVIWIDALTFALIELVGSIAVGGKPIGDLTIRYHGKDITAYMEGLMQAYVPQQADFQIRKIFSGLKNDYGFNPLPKADPKVKEFAPGKTRDALIMTADLFAREVFQRLRDKRNVIPLIGTQCIVKNLTEILIRRD